MPKEDRNPDELKLSQVFLQLSKEHQQLVLQLIYALGGEDIARPPQPRPTQRPSPK
jgi:hypothetical protein